MSFFKWLGLPQTTANEFEDLDASENLDAKDVPFSATPIILDSPHQVLLITCISIRDETHYRILHPSTTCRLRLCPSIGIPLQQSVNVDNLDVLTIGLPPSDCFSNQYEVSIKLYHDADRALVLHGIEHIKIPLHLGGCRFSHFPLNSLSATMCLVHQLVDVSDDTDLFIEQEEFLFTAMSIQHNLFLGESIPSPVHYVESKVVLSTSWMNEADQIEPSQSSYFDSTSILDEEIQAMNTLTKLYESQSKSTTRNSSFSIN